MDDEKKPADKLSSYLRADVLPKHADFLLLATCFGSGLTDSTLFNAYNTFVSMQTGNTIFLGLGASHQNTQPWGWAHSLTAIGCFTIGCFVFSRINIFLGPKKRGTLSLSFFLQSILVFITAALIQAGVINGGVSGTDFEKFGPQWGQEVPICLLSFQSAGQIVSSRVLGYNEIPTVVITSLICDLMSDPKLFSLDNIKRDRRVVAFILTLVGAIAGGWISRSTGTISPALWIIGGIKILISVAWLFWHTEKEDGEVW